MKKSMYCLVVMLLLLTFVPVNAFAAEPVTTAITADPKAEVPAEVKVMLDRLNEIKAMDKSDLSRTEKRALRKEVRTIKADLKKAGGGVYLSVGAIIIIILLLILLL